MPFAFFWIPAREAKPAEDELNRFLASHRVTQVEKAFCAGSEGPGWSLCLQWVPSEARKASAAVAIE